MFNPEDYRQAKSWEIRTYPSAGSALTNEEADALPPNSLFTAQNGQWYMKKPHLEVGFYIPNYQDGAGEPVSLDAAISLLEGRVVERTGQIIIARFPGRAGNRRQILERTLNWCWGSWDS